MALDLGGGNVRVNEIEKPVGRKMKILWLKDEISDDDTSVTASNLD